MAKHVQDNPCDMHFPVQRRDGKEPWCRKCGKNAEGNEPFDSFAQSREK